MTTTVRRERCEKSDLWPDECAHCRGLQLDIDLAEQSITHRWAAKNDGTCPMCLQSYDKGDLLMRTVDGERVCERCRT